MNVVLTTVAACTWGPAEGQGNRGVAPGLAKILLGEGS